MTKKNVFSFELPNKFKELELFDYKHDLTYELTKRWSIENKVRIKEALNMINWAITHLPSPDNRQEFIFVEEEYFETYVSGQIDRLMFGSYFQIYDCNYSYKFLTKSINIDWNYIIDCIRKTSHGEMLLDRRIYIMINCITEENLQLVNQKLKNEGLI